MIRSKVRARLAAFIWKFLYSSGTAISRIGERYDADWLIYNPLLFLWFHFAGVVVAPTIYDGLREFFPDARRLLDVGAGSGTMAARGQRIGLDVQACERSPVARLIARTQGVHSVPFDLNLPNPAAVDSTFDMVYCFEVGEHLPDPLVSRLVSFIAGRAPVIVFSAARPGQGGHGHINEQPSEYWIDRFQGHGCEFDAETTDRMRGFYRESPTQIDWLINNLLVFRASPVS